MIARGIAVSEIYEGEHWADSKRMANYVDWEPIDFLSIDDRLPTENLD